MKQWPGGGKWHIVSLSMTCSFQLLQGRYVPLRRKKKKKSKPYKLTKTGSNL